MKYYKNVSIEEVSSYDELSEYTANLMLETVKTKPDALICLASGGSPEKAYRLFVQRVKEQKIDVSSVRFLKLDEWLGVSGEDPSTCEHYIRSIFVEPLSVKEENYISFNSDASDPEAECDRICRYLEKNPIDLCILGMGKDGHVGLNEPAASLHPYTHVAVLHEKTNTHELLTQTSNPVDKGMTIGMQNILASEKVLFLLTGADKQEVYEKFCAGEVTTEVPCTLLWVHKNLVCLIDTSTF